MTGSRWPFPWPDGEPASLRATLHRRPVSAAQRRALEQGRDVTFDTAWLTATFPRGDEHPSLPPDLGEAEAWVLSGDDTLTPVVG